MADLSSDEVRAFQARHKNHLGKPLKVDGDLGPQTRWAMDYETLHPHRRAIIRAAQKHLGLVEDPIGSNTEPLGIIQGMLQICGARGGDPWCAAYASHCLTFGLGTPVRCASAQALGKMFPSTNNPMAGDLAWYPTDSVHGHVWVVTGITPIGVTPAEVMGIEANSNNRVRCTRRPMVGLRFARTVADVTGRCPGVIVHPDIPLITGALAYGTR
jgi:hypothetical protein